MNAIDLFCGCGGASLGLKLAGYKMVGAVDTDPIACKTYHENLGLEPICADLRCLDSQQILNHYGLKKDGIDVVVGCPPCQGFSSLRRTRYPEKTDPRKSLVTAFLKRIKEIEPRAVILENVSGIGTKKGKQYYLNRFINIMEKMGYKSNWALINAADYGIAQFRKRVFACFAKTDNSLIMPEKIYSNPEKCTTSEIWKTVENKIKDMQSCLQEQVAPLCLTT